MPKITNWKTTLAGLGSVLTALGDFLTATYDGDPVTNPNWMLIGTALTVGIGLIFAKDSNK